MIHSNVPDSRSSKHHRWQSTRICPWRSNLHVGALSVIHCHGTHAANLDRWLHEKCSGWCKQQSYRGVEHHFFLKLFLLGMMTCTRRCLQFAMKFAPSTRCSCHNCGSFCWQTGGLFCQIFVAICQHSFDNYHFYLRSLPKKFLLFCFSWFSFWPLQYEI